MFYLCLFVYLQRYGNKQLQCWLICGKIVPFFVVFLFVPYDKFIVVNLVYE